MSYTRTSRPRGCSARFDPGLSQCHLHDTTSGRPPMGSASPGSAMKQLGTMKMGPRGGQHVVWKRLAARNIPLSLFPRCRETSATRSTLSLSPFQLFLSSAPSLHRQENPCTFALIYCPYHLQCPRPGRAADPNRWRLAHTCVGQLV